MFKPLFAILVCGLFASPLAAAEPERPRLLVLVVFDQLRGDYLERWGKQFGKDGFQRLMTDGAWFANCHYPYATTQTGPGHASMLTGCAPDQHGIIANNWYDRKSAMAVNCSESERYQRVPALPKTLPAEQLKNPMPDTTDDDTKESKPKVKLAGSPEYLLAPTLGDVLKEATGGKSRIVGLSFKDRSALLPVGRTADAVYWLDSNDGMIVTSSFYRDSVHDWVAELNKARFADQWFEKEWNRSRGDLSYATLAGPDQMAGEGKGVRQGVVFPHMIDGGLKKPAKSYYEALFNSPFGNDFLLEVTKRAIIAEKLGQDDVTDLLVVSFSSNDAIGHCWGPDSQEVLDVTLRSDRALAELLRFLDEKVGAGKYTLALTADHGVCPLPEVSAARGLDAKRVSLKKILTAAELHLAKKFATTPADSKSRWIISAISPWIYLNDGLADAKGIKLESVAEELARFLATQEGIHRAFTRSQLDGEIAKEDVIATLMKKSYHPERSGDVGIVIAPYYLGDGTLTGTSHGTPHAYDTHVPLLYFGQGIKAAVRQDRATPQTIASVLAQVAGLPAPKLACYPVPEGLVK
jgi:predicted AlkP superfamily pyrophosphatase or phosphodiesterase